MILKIKSNELGLAAYLKMNNEELIKIEDRCFYFSSDVDLDIWKLSYLNSDCSSHDKYVMELRDMLPPISRGRRS